MPECHDDGGISGSTMERPALQHLLADIDSGKVDVVIVYKIDRLTCFLMDFARIVEIFDRHDVSFVSITQQFNTTTSMGRLTLNVLLSFAQFEREVTAERIRDKVAASKKSRDWMQAAGQTASIEAGLAKAGNVASLVEATAPRSQNDIRAIIHLAIRRIDLAGDSLRFAIDKNALTDWLADPTMPADELAIGRARSRGSLPLHNAALHTVDLPLAIRKRGIERRLVIEGQGASLQRPDRALINMVARAHVYLEDLTDGQALGRKDIAERYDVHPEDVSRLLPLAFLSPYIVEAILTGQQPTDLSVRHLARGIELPVGWSDQAKLLGI